MRSHKEISADKKLLKKISNLLIQIPEKEAFPVKIAKALLSDSEIQASIAESRLILLADGCDMTKGRTRIPNKPIKQHL